MGADLTAAEVFERLQRRILGPEGQGHRAFLFGEVEVGGSRADAISMDLWGSRGHVIQGFEIKVDRRDWLNELDHPEKADPVVQKVDQFWLVTNPDIVHPGELPEQWGHLVTAGKRRHLKVVKPAPAREKLPPDHALVVSMLRRVQMEGIDNAAAARAEAREANRAAAPQDFEGLQRRLTMTEESNREMREAYEGFRRESGIDFLSWSPDKANLELLGSVVAALSDKQRGEFLLRSLKHDEDRLGAARRLVKTAREKLEEETTHG